MHGDHHGLWIDPDEAGDPLQRERRRLLPVGRCRQDVEVRACGRRRAVLQRRRSTRARRRGPTDRSRTIGSRRGRMDLSAGRDRIPAVEFVERARRRGIESRRSIRPNPNIVYSHGFYGNFTRDDRRSAAAARRPAAPRRRPGTRTRRRHARSGRKWPTTSCARSGWRRSSSRRTTPSVDLRGLPVRLPFGQSRRRVGEDQPRPDRQRSGADAAAEPQRDPVPDDHRAGGVAAPAGPALCGDRRRPAARDAGRRQDVDRADRERAGRKWISRVVPSQHADGDGLRHAARARRRRLRGLRLQVHRLRQDVHEHRGEHPRRSGERHSRGSARPERPVCLGTDFGAFVSVDGGRQWNVLGGDLPSVQVSDLQYHGRDN